MIGIARTQVSAGNPKAGSVTIADPAAVGVLTPINVSTLGTVDWMACGTPWTTNTYANDLSFIYEKLLGGWIRKSFRMYGPNVPSISTPTDSLFVITSDIDDTATFNGLINQNFLNAVQTYAQLAANNVNPYSNWGFRFRAQASNIKTRTLRLYFSYGCASLGNQLTISARLSDGSAATVSKTLVPAVVAKNFYSIDITFRSKESSCDLIVATNVQNIIGNSATTHGFIAAVVFDN